MRAVLDTNILISRYLSPHAAPSHIFGRWRLDAFELVVTEPILAEYQEVLSYDRLRRVHRLSDEEISSIVEDFREFATVVEPNKRLHVILDDPDDDKFLEAALAGEAEFVVSGDRHLLQLKTYGGIRIVTPSVFLAILQQEAPSEE
jgi:putative PIN family toxin of toxin-antitoxin system